MPRAQVCTSEILYTSEYAFKVQTVDSIPTRIIQCGWKCPQIKVMSALEPRINCFTSNPMEDRNNITEIVPLSNASRLRTVFLYREAGG